MENEEKIEWSALEFEEKERSNDWFWALGIIILAGAVTSIIYSNYFFAILLVLGGILLGSFAIKKPEMILYEINENGVKINNDIYPYKKIKSFWIQKRSADVANELPPTLFIKSSRLVMPIISIPLEDAHVDPIRGMMLSKNITEEEMHEHPTVKVMDSLGF